MAKMTFLMIQVDGGDETLQSVIRTAAATIARSMGVEPGTAAPALMAPAAAELPAPEPPAAMRGGDATEIRPEPRPAEDAEIPAPRRPGREPGPKTARKPKLNDAGLPKRFGRKIAIEGHDCQFTKDEAAERLGATANAIAQTCTPTGQKRGGRVKGKRVWFADGGPGEPSQPAVPTAMASLPSGYRPPSRPISNQQSEISNSHHSRPRSNGEAMAINPNRVGADAPVPQEPQRSHGSGWQPRNQRPTGMSGGDLDRQECLPHQEAV